MRSEACCTVYKSNGNGYYRYFIPNCHWQENKAGNVIKSGMHDADSVTVYIPADCMIVTPSKNYYPANYLILSAETVPNRAVQDIIVKGECYFSFDNTSQQSVSESLREFAKNNRYHTVMSIDRKLYGSKKLQHIKISAR